MPSLKRSLAGVLLTAALALPAGTAGAQEGQRRRPEQIPPTGAEDSAQPTAEDEAGKRLIDATTSESTKGLTFEHRTDGTIGLDLQGRFMNVLTASPGKDGRIEVSCNKSGDGAPAALAAVKPWSPARGQTLHRLDVKPLKAPIVVAPKKAPVLEEK
jgi:hypothetical protein